MKKIGLDLRVLIGRNYTGIERYAYNLACELTQYQTEEYYFIGEFRNERLKVTQRIDLDLPRSNTMLASKLLSLKGTLAGLDLLFSPYYPIPERRTFKGVLVIHDLIPLLFPEFYYNAKAVYDYFDQALRSSARSCDHIIADSETTKNDIIKLFLIPEEKISVVPLASFQRSAITQDQSNTHDVLKKYKIDSPYLLSVCTIEPRKNLSRVLGAYEIIRQRTKDKIKLVLVGGLGWKYHDLLKEINENRYSSDIILTGYVSDQDLLTIYQQAEVFVFPSLYEGFGLPVLEAMSMEAPVVTSNSSSLPEVAGEAAIYCNPYSTESIAEAIEKVIFDPEGRSNLIKLGKERAQLFSWAETARKTREIFLKVLS